MKQVLPLLAILLTSCTTTRTVPLETLRHDTIYLHNMQYDSIYITRTSDTDRTRDTITITKTEYRFRLLRDTIRIARIDSIPYEVRITEIKKVKHIPPWCKWLSAIGGIALLLLAINFYRKFISIV